MDKNLSKIYTFIDKHHVMSLATSSDKELSACNLFYVFSPKELSFIVASSEDTEHIENIMLNCNIAGTIVLETKIVAKIEGLQFRGKFFLLEDKELKKLYFKTFPYALAMDTKLWQIKVGYFKLTDNTLGFGKKVIWQEALV